MTNPPTFSIVIPTYKRTDQLIDCLKSLESQIGGRTDSEVIVVNDGGRQEEFNEIPSIIPSLAICVHHLGKNQGPAAARNAGIKLARGTYILLLDDDSLLMPMWLTIVTQTWESDSSLDGFGGFIVIDPNQSLPCRFNAVYFNWFLRESETSSNRFFLTTCNASYKKLSLEKVGGFNERFKTAAGEDLDLSVKLAKAGAKIKLVDKMLVQHERNLTFGSFLKKHFLYGKAACKVRRLHTDITFFPLRAYGRFLKTVLREFKTYEKMAAVNLLIFSQIAVTVGFLSEWRTTRQ